MALIDKLYHKLDPTEETAQLKKLNLVGDRITFLDGPGFDDLCAKILDSPTAFFHFINFITLDFVHLYSELGYSEMCKSDLNSALEWSFDTAPNPDIDWRKKYVHFEEKISNRKPGEPIPTFLQSAQALHTAEGRDNLYRSYLLQNYPDLLKKPTHISLANNRLPLFSFLNRRENLFSLSIDCCEFGPDEAEEDPDDEVLLTTTLRFFSHKKCDFLHSILLLY